MNKNEFLNCLKNYKGINVFNPYADTCSIHDKNNAAQIRTNNLSIMLNKFMDLEVDSIWIGRDLGHKGGRRTGLALTDENHLASANKKWGIELCQATKGDLVGERTAKNIWNFIESIDQNIFLWNVFPFHPHEANKELSNRSHTAAERNEGLIILESLIKLLEPKNLVGIGNDAYKYASKISRAGEVIKIRHPSYGGEKEFTKQMTDFYK